ncbi:Lysocardiolipin acyltransferase 1 [Eumeta japonica]|uniref:Lysocardiolipin acyltransferase 1 n=1 Tax=Eumeta variegata TaxID=151549 RepID=A0A4C1Z4T5_EUMVA|nr:Lysocardiolipin acyltransferase 1 [Eumeta japonica]
MRRPWDNVATPQGVATHSLGNPDLYGCWIMQLNYFLYVKRDWRRDQRGLSEFLDYYRRLRHACRIVLFPEGTDLSDDNRRRSDRYAALRNLPCYEYVLHPRTTGWTALCSRSKEIGLKAVYDVTLAYDHPPQTEADMLLGRLPRHVHFFVKRYTAEALPEDDISLKNWLNDRWREKENNLKRFYTEGHFIDTSTNEVSQERKPRSLRRAKIGFFVLDIY